MTQDASAIDRSAVAALTPVVHPTPQGGRGREVEEVVEAFVFASSPNNSFMTGQTIHVDGGLTGY